MCNINVLSQSHTTKHKYIYIYTFINNHFIHINSFIGRFMNAQIH